MSRHNTELEQMKTHIESKKAQRLCKQQRQRQIFSSLSIGSKESQISSVSHVVKSIETNSLLTYRYFL
jgi:hypothetical protein